MGNRPLVICDCDEVLLHFALPFGNYLASRNLELRFDSFALTGNIRRCATGKALDQHEIEPLIDGFFETHMETQYPVDGAVAALRELSEIADVAILTNVRDWHRTRRGAELARHGMPYPVMCNAGPKGPAVLKLIVERSAAPVVFVDDLPPHHKSVRQVAPDVYRLHMVADARLRTLIEPAPDAHVRADTWVEALPYIRAALG